MTIFTSVQIREFRELILGKTVTEFYYNEDKGFYTLIAQVPGVKDRICALAKVEFRFLADLSQQKELERPHKK